MKMLKIPSILTACNLECSENCINYHPLEICRRAQNSKSRYYGIYKHLSRIIIPPSIPFLWINSLSIFLYIIGSRTSALS